MPLVLADRVNETTTTTSTGTITLAGAVSGYQSFAVIGNGNTTYYTIVHQTANEWEVGIGTYTSSGTTLSRDTVLASSNSGSLVNFSAGTKFVFCDYPAGRAVYLDTATNVTIPGLTLSGGTANGVLYLNGSKVATSGSALTFDGTNFATTGRATANDFLASGGAFYTVVGGATYGSLIATAGTLTLNANNGTGLIFSVASTEGMRLTSTGLGIGTSSPAQKLNVNGIALFEGSAQGNIIIQKTGTNGFSLFSDAAGKLGFYDQNGAATRMLIDSSGNLLVGQATNTQNYRLVIKGSAGSADDLAFNSDATRSEIQSFNSKPLELNRQGNNVTIGSAGSGNLGIGTASPGYKLSVAGASGSAVLNLLETGVRSWGIRAGGTATNTFDIADFTAGATRLTIDSSGNLGLGVTPSAWNSVYRAFNYGSRGLLYSRTDNDETGFGVNWYRNSGGSYLYSTNGFATYLRTGSGAFEFFTAPSGTAGNAISFTQAMTLDASGNLVVGGTSADARFTAIGSSASSIVTVATLQNPVNAAGTGHGARLILHSTADTGRGVAIASSSSANYATDNAMLFYTSASSTLTERARITSGGIFLVGTTNTDPVGGNVPGISMSGGGVFGASADSAAPCVFNRKTDDGILVAFYQDAIQEGNISVSGNTVSYNAFAGSHWSQLQDGSKPDILRGTVMESINELCVWPGEQNERLPKAKVSDTAGSKKVYGVFMAWDNDWATTNDMYITAVGAFICRVNGSVTVQEGDLLESNGDGTARVQADDIIRSSTIGKVTSTVKTHQYADGSYCVPTVLYCG